MYKMKRHALCAAQKALFFLLFVPDGAKSNLFRRIIVFNIIPQPNQIIISKGKPSFSLSPDTTVTKTDFTTEFRDFVKKQFDIRIHREISDDVSIKLVKSSEVAGEEGLYAYFARRAHIYLRKKRVRYFLRLANPKAAAFAGRWHRSRYVYRG